MPALPDLRVLDDPVGESLRNSHAHLARSSGSVLGYDTDVSTFLAVPTEADPDTWRDVAGLVGPGGFADLFSSSATPPHHWAPVFTLSGVQMVSRGPLRPPTAVAAEVVALGPADVPDMLDLARRTEPGPFWARTIEMGTYLGVRDEDRLVAMAGERLRPPGWGEVSAVCTAPEARGRGLAALLVAEVVARVRERGDEAFLHVADGSPARRVYERLGFEVRRAVVFRGFRAPGAAQENDANGAAAP